MLSLTCVPAFSESNGAHTMQQIEAALPHAKDEPMPEIKYELEKQSLTSYPGAFRMRSRQTISRFPKA
jgi:hypothetical protein